jgi:acyl-CoA synthetase (AMP-forming)/AMP-acid ligase II
MWFILCVSVCQSFLFILRGLFAQTVICGAEPIRAQDVKSFVDFFGSCGLDPLCFMPSYGLAEFTLCATAQVCMFVRMHLHARM